MPQATIPVEAKVNGQIITCHKRNLEAEDDDAGLAWFDFESENSLATATGTLLWDASFFIIDLLNDQTPVMPCGCTLAQLISQRRVVELGAGIGLASLCCAAVGAHVLCTDLPSIVDGIMKRNIEANSAIPVACTAPPGQLPSTDPAQPFPTAAATSTQASQTAADCPSTGIPSSNSTVQECAQEAGDAATQSGSQPWPQSRQCGAGTIASMPLDFCRPLYEQVHYGRDARDAEVVLAADIVWLKELVRPLAETVADILRPRICTHKHTDGRHTGVHASQGTGPGTADCAAHNAVTAADRAVEPHSADPASTGCDNRTVSGAQSGKVAFIAFGERATPTSTLFISLDEVCGAFRACGCEAEVAVRRVMQREPGESMPVVLLRITMEGRQ